jgi:RNA polymerase-binding transcription factor DksA
MTSLATDAWRRLEEHRSGLEQVLVQGGKAAEEAALELAETRAALERIALGKYGRCESCGGAIGRQRLLALPMVRYCISCAGSAGRAT